MLNTQPHLQACDDFYEALINAHQGLSTPDSHAMNARLVLLLANHIGDHATLCDALRLARGAAGLKTATATATPTATPTEADHQAITPVLPTHAMA
ncbi:hypothetical protein ASF11_13805 [Acidovorax sp. Leaf76]|uniref:DUF2783 domain-containing protein n=1 Tax=unclassified Acidovorax TaxID=2684926 RepID=UPI0006FD8DC4|nr:MULTISPECIES: DUF2783 domain-containing protein [unclassified Acidovorax]KQO13913.1 hypothetical protein ASF11_13805 [Acidovorax sp. Leaf76]KQO31434.1 hypothetical protein ASF19_11500 [Acidovorax sp. Leaf84]KQS27454.1 hypothetical protein ASG27_15635 [Acidovorax sp. Leaf191]RZJ55877.1 MAG: DUF2783 domain-containing protein [Acidovorax sp.]